MSYSRLVAFGEAMIRLTTAPGVPLDVAGTFSAPVGGAELNAAIAARRSGLDSLWVSTLPSGPLGDLVSRHAGASGVAVDLRRIDRARLGLYFLELATPPRASRIIYDRARSAFALFPDPETEWRDLLDDRTCFLVSGITPAVSREARSVVANAMAAARVAGATVALDVNYRSALWSIDEAFAWLEETMNSVDILCAGASDLSRLGIDGPDLYQKAVAHLGLQAVVGSAKGLEGSGVHIEVTAATEDEIASSSALATVVDPVGSGDAMFGTFLAEFGRRPLGDCVDRAMGAAVASFGLAGDALTADPWTADENGDVRR